MKIIERLYIKLSIRTFIWGVYIFTVVLICVNLWLKSPHWWTYDDPLILKEAAQYSPFDYFLNPSIYRQCCLSFLTPFLILSYDVDLSLFGLNPSAFYLHHIIVIGIISVLIFFMISRYTSITISAMISLLFLLSVPLAKASSLLMTRHYFEGLLFALLSVLYFQEYLLNHKKKLQIFSLFFYGLSSLCKEIYVPLPIVLTFLPDNDNYLSYKYIKTRLKCVSPFYFVTLFYAVYRRWVLGHWIGGYGSFGSTSIDMLSLLKGLNGNILYNKFILQMIVSMLLTLSVMYARRNGKLLFAVILIFTVCAPLLPVNASASRFCILPSLVMLFFIAYGLDKLWSENRIYAKLAAILLLGGLSFISIQLHFKAIRDINQSTIPFAKIGKFLWYQTDEQDVVIGGIYVPGDYYNKLRWLRLNVAQNGKLGYGITNLCDFVMLGDKSNIVKRWWRYDATLQAVVPVDRVSIDKWTLRCKKNFVNKRLYAYFFERNAVLYWKFGPYNNGYYALVDPNVGEIIRMSKTGHIPISLTSLTSSSSIINLTKLFVCYKDDNGWEVCVSPQFPENSGSLHGFFGVDST